MHLDGTSLILYAIPVTYFKQGPVYQSVLINLMANITRALVVMSMWSVEVKFWPTGCAGNATYIYVCLTFALLNVEHSLTVPFLSSLLFFGFFTIITAMVLPVL